jgi:hypothetical protein
MRNIVKDPFTKPLAGTVLQLVAFSGWAACDFPWFVERRMFRLVAHLVGRPLWLCISDVIGLAVSGAALVLSMIEMLVLAVAFAEGGAHWFGDRRGGS